MTEIPIERKSSGVPWWVWLLGALLLIALLFWLLSDNDREEVAAVAPVEQSAVVAAPAAEAGGPITDLATLTSAGGLAALVGREVRLSAVPVTSVVGDRTFFVGEGPQRAFVVLNEQPAPGNDVEGRYNVQQGQMVDVNGVVRRTGDSALSGDPVEGLPTGQDAVIHAQSLNIVQRP